MMGLGMRLCIIHFYLYRPITTFSTQLPTRRK